MKIRTRMQGGIAIDCRSNAYFKKGDILEIGYKGLTQEHLQDLVNTNCADVVTENEPEVQKSENDDLETEEPIPEYKTFTEKVDLETHAKDKYGIDLDRRKTLEGMIDQLETELETGDE